MQGGVEPVHPRPIRERTVASGNGREFGASLDAGDRTSIQSSIEELLPSPAPDLRSRYGVVLLKRGFEASAGSRRGPRVRNIATCAVRNQALREGTEHATRSSVASATRQEVASATAFGSVATLDRAIRADGGEPLQAVEVVEPRAGPRQGSQRRSAPEGRLVARRRFGCGLMGGHGSFACGRVRA